MKRKVCKSCGELISRELYTCNFCLSKDPFGYKKEKKLVVVSFTILVVFWPLMKIYGV